MDDETRILAWQRERHTGSPGQDCLFIQKLRAAGLTPAQIVAVLDTLDGT